MAYNKFSKHLRDLIEFYDYSQTELGKKTGVSQPTINRYLNGVREPSFDDLLLLCYILQTTPSEILGWEELPDEYFDNILEGIANNDELLDNIDEINQQIREDKESAKANCSVLDIINQNKNDDKN